MNIFNQGANWEATRFSDLQKSVKYSRIRECLWALCLLGCIGALVVLTPLRRTIPYVVKQDVQTGNLEVLQPFDNRMIGKQELLNKYWARKYVTAREQYNWWFVSADYDTVSALTDGQIFKEYGDQFLGEKGLDKVFGDFTERRVKILSIAPSPTTENIMVVRFERTTISKGTMVEAPTVFQANLAFRYAPSAYAAEAELMRNPMGFQVYSYRRDVEVPATTPTPGVSPATGG